MPGDVISIKEGAKKQLRIQGSLALSQAKPVCSWLEIDVNDLKAFSNRYQTWLICHLISM